MTCSDVPETFNQRQSVLGLIFFLTSSDAICTLDQVVCHACHCTKVVVGPGAKGDFDQDVLRQYLHVLTRYEAPKLMIFTLSTQNHQRRVTSASSRL